MKKLDRIHRQQSKEFVLAAIVGVGLSNWDWAHASKAAKAAVDFGLKAYLEFESRFEDTSETPDHQDS